MFPLKLAVMTPKQTPDPRVRCWGVTMCTHRLCPQRSLLSVYSVSTATTLELLLLRHLPKVVGSHKMELFMWRKTKHSKSSPALRNQEYPKPAHGPAMCTCPDRQSLTWDQMHYLSFCLLLLERNHLPVGRNLE